MKFYVGVTDDKWFEYLADLRPDEVSFWRPGSIRNFRAVGRGAPFLFKLHSPRNYIVGGGFFVGAAVMPLSLAWETFGKKNGAPTFSDLVTRIGKYRSDRDVMESDPQKTFIVLTSPFFFSEFEWIPQPIDWRGVRQGKTYDTDEPGGASLWARVQERLEGLSSGTGMIREKDALLPESDLRYGAEQIIRPRLGQGGFRVLVTQTYNRRCAITGERTLPVLQAAHIKPYSDSGPHRISNGLLLRSDLHILFDRGLITVNRDYSVEVSRRIRDEYENGKDYYAFQGRKLIVIPNREVERPSIDFLDYHNEHVFAT